MSCTLSENVLLPTLRRFWNKGKLARRTMNLCVDIFDVQPRASNDMLFGKFSGGNQQKVVLAKWLAVDSKIIIFDEPTRGVDVGAKAEIYKLMCRLAQDGKAVIMISSDLPELIGVCDRIYVMREGTISGELTRESFSQETILGFAVS